MELNVELNERIAAVVARMRRDVPRDDFLLAACDHADSVLARHELKGTELRDCAINGYAHSVYPCPEVRDLALMWLGPGWEET